MQPILSLSDELVVSVLQDWLQVKDVVRLDSACGGSENIRFLLRCGMYHFTVPRGRSVLKLLSWVRKRSIAIDCISAGGDLTTLRPTWAEFFKKEGPLLRTLEWHGKWDDLLLSCPNVTKLAFRTGFTWTKEKLRMLSSAFPKLECLYLDEPYMDVDTAASEQGASFDVLKSLTINTGYMHPDMFAFLQNIMPGVENLEMIKTHTKSRLIPPDGWPNLTHLKAHRSDAALFLPLLRSHRNLLKLSVSLSTITDTQLVEFAPALSGLTHLRLHYLDDVTNLGMCALIEACPKLTVLQISANATMTDAIIDTVARCCPQIEHLTLRDKPKFSMACLSNCLRACPAMKSVTFGYFYAAVHYEHLQQHKHDFQAQGVALRYDTNATEGNDGVSSPFFGRF